MKEKKTLSHSWTFIICLVQFCFHLNKFIFFLFFIHFSINDDNFILSLHQSNILVTHFYNFNQIVLASIEKKKNRLRID